MVNRKINGKDILLFIDSTNEGDTYDKVICLTSNGLDRSTSVESASSKCGTDSGPGEKTITVPIAGVIVYQAEAGSMSSPSFDSLWKNSTQIAWKQGPVTPVEGDVIYTGSGWLSDLNETADSNGRATFTATLQVSDYTQSITTAGSGSGSGL